MDPQTVAAAASTEVDEDFELESLLFNRKVALRVWFEDNRHRWPSYVKTTTFMGLHIRCLQESPEYNRGRPDCPTDAFRDVKPAYRRSQLRRRATDEVVSPWGGRTFVGAAAVLHEETFVLEAREPRAVRLTAAPPVGKLSPQKKRRKRRRGEVEAPS